MFLSLKKILIYLQLNIQSSSSTSKLFFDIFVPMPKMFMSTFLIITMFTFDSCYILCHKQTPLIILFSSKKGHVSMRHKILLSTFICMWPSILLMYNINARGNDSQSTKTVYCLSNLKPLKIKTTLTKIKYKKGIKSWREKRI